jgi:hypothetical protein
VVKYLADYLQGGPVNNGQIEKNPEQNTKKEGSLCVSGWCRNCPSEVFLIVLRLLIHTEKQDRRFCGTNEEQSIQA